MLSFRQFRRLTEAKKIASKDPPPPAMLIFKRLATRTFPDGRIVSSYYSSEIKKHVIFPNTYE